MPAEQVQSNLYNVRSSPMELLGLLALASAFGLPGLSGARGEKQKGLEWVERESMAEVQQKSPHCGPLWSAVIRCGPLWSAVVHYSPLWSSVVRCGPL
ncbi:hypothetical protein STEG23_035793 [Scotinomys teguina]